jgi:hypothetical protein
MLLNFLKSGLIFSLLLLASCFVAYQPKTSSICKETEAAKGCQEYCKAHYGKSWYRLHYRNKTTFFCDCIETIGIRETIVVSKSGTVYK